MRILTALNLMMATAGYGPVNSAIDSHPFLPACLANLDALSANEQQRGWWFNREVVTLLPSAIDNAVYIPADCLNVWVATQDRMWMGMKLVQRGDRLYNTHGGTYVIGAPVDVVLVRQVPFEQLPESMAQHIAAVARLWVQSTYDGDTTKASMIASSSVYGASGTLARVNAEEIRNTPLNIHDITAGVHALRQSAHVRRSGED